MSADYINASLNPGRHRADPFENLPDLLLPSEVAKVFRVNPKTVTRWVKAGKLAAIRTAGGHRRFRTEDVKALYNNSEIDL